MKCVICQGEQIELRDVNEEIKFDNDIVYVPIRTLVCHSCGERYYDRRTMAMLEETEDQIRQRKARLKELGKVLVLG